MNLGLWIAQIVVGAAFILAGVLKSSRPIPELAQRMKWAGRLAPATVRFIGVSELAGGIGVIVPWATGIARVLTPIAAAALVVVMILAEVEHLKHREWPEMIAPAVGGLVAAFVAWGRF
jgi:uncharacterized membrane protein YphA (DoxX/SURF4 family)